MGPVRGPLPGVLGIVWKLLAWAWAASCCRLASSLMPSRWKVAYGEMSCSCCAAIESPAASRVGSDRQWYKVRG